jgi:hypothetical protein
MTWFETKTAFQAMLTWLQTITKATCTYYTIGADHGLMWVHVNRYVRNHEYIYIYIYVQAMPPLNLIPQVHVEQSPHWLPNWCLPHHTFPDQQIHDVSARTAVCHSRSDEQHQDDMPNMTNTITHMLCNMEAYTFMAITFKPKFWIGKYITD